MRLPYLTIASLPDSTPLEAVAGKRVTFAGIVTPFVIVFSVDEDAFPTEDVFPWLLEVMLFAFEKHFTVSTRN